MKLLLTSHGSLCHGLMESYQMIAGDNADISALALDHDGIGKFRERLTQVLNQLSEGDSVLILCDIKGGTPYNESYRYILEHDRSIQLVTGMNLPMLIEVGTMLAHLDDLAVAADMAVAAGLASVEKLDDAEDDDDDLF